MTIISHCHEFIFLKTPKTAGTSIEVWLAPLLGASDKIKSAGELTQAYPELGHSSYRGVGPSQRRLRKLTGRPWRIWQHSPARHVRSFVGKRRFDRYTKLAVVRNPWDRMISLLRWRQQKCGSELQMDAMLDRIEAGEDRLWQSWHIYTIDDVIVADRVVRYENLVDELTDALHAAGLDPPGAMPFAKSGHRTAEDAADKLTQGQIDRIAALHRREIDAYGYEPGFKSVTEKVLP